MSQDLPRLSLETRDKALSKTEDLKKVLEVVLLQKLAQWLLSQFTKLMEMMRMSGPPL
jgi:hypothetical protein